MSPDETVSVRTLELRIECVRDAFNAAWTALELARRTDGRTDCLRVATTALAGALRNLEAELAATRVTP